jgi:hypothetical protein
VQRKQATVQATRRTTGKEAVANPINSHTAALEAGKAKGTELRLGMVKLTSVFTQRS